MHSAPNSGIYLQRVSLWLFWFLSWFGVVTALASAQDGSVTDKSGFGGELKSDPRLKVRIKKNFVMPKVPEVLKTLESGTGLEFTCNDMIELNEEAFGSLSFWNTSAWIVMTQLAKSKAVKGTWRKTERGYTLVGTLSREAQAERVMLVTKGLGPARAGESYGFLTCNAILALIVLLTRYAWRQRRTQPT